MLSWDLGHQAFRRLDRESYRIVDGKGEASVKTNSEILDDEVLGILKPKYKLNNLSPRLI